jgi:hypothetical protein
VPSINTSSMAWDVPKSYPVQIEEWPTHQSWSSDESDPDNDNDNEDSDSNPDNHEESNNTETQQCTIPAATLPLPLPASNGAPIPPARFYSKAPKPSQRGHDTEAYISVLKNEVTVLRQENTELAAYTVLAFDHVRGLKHCLNAKGPGSKRRKLNTDLRWLN